MKPNITKRVWGVLREMSSSWDKRPSTKGPV